MKKNVLCFILSAAMTVTMCMPVMAAVHGTSGTDGYGGTYSYYLEEGDTPGSNAGTSKTKVVANIDSSWAVVVPAVINLAPDETNPAYTHTNSGEEANIECYGNLALDKKIAVSVANSFAMVSESDADDVHDAHVELEHGLVDDTTHTSTVNFVKSPNVSNTNEIAIGALPESAAKAKLDIGVSLTNAGSYIGRMTVNFAMQSR